MEGKMSNTSDFEQRTYNGLRSLAELPYFELDSNGLPRLTVDGLEGGIDGHVHFALIGFDGPKPDLLKAHPETKYSLNANGPIAMNNYVAENFTEQDLHRMLTDRLAAVSPTGSPTTTTHTIPNLFRELDNLHIDRAVILPIAHSGTYGNDLYEWYRDAIKKSGKEDRFIVCGTVRPTLPSAVETVRKQKLDGVRGIKIHPVWGRFTPNDGRAWACYEECASLGLPVLAHTGTDWSGKWADIDNFAEPIAAFPNLRFVLCHSGRLQNERAIEIAKQNKNAWLDVHGQSVANIRTMIKELGPERLLFGSDWPLFPVAVLLARLLLATEGDHTVRKMIFRENAERFWGLT
jgi:uncharacterized protein